MTRLILVRYIIVSFKIFNTENEVAEYREILLATKGTKGAKMISDLFCAFCAFCGYGLGSTSDRNDHGNGLLITTIILAEGVHEIFLFELDRDEDVCSRGDSEDEMRHRHRRR